MPGRNRLQNIRRQRWLRHAVGLMGDQIRICRQRYVHGSILVIELHPLALHADNGQRLDAKSLQLLTRRAQLRDVTPAKRAVEAAHQGEQHRRLATIVCQRHHSVTVHGGQHEVRCHFSCADRCAAFRSDHGFSISAEKRQDHQ
jgi:hypothetical protein